MSSGNWIVTFMARALHPTAGAGSGEGACSAPRVVPAIVPETRQDRRP